MTNPFSARFYELDTLADIRRLTTVHSDSVTGLEKLSPALAAGRLREVLKTIFLPNQFSLDFIKDNVDRAHTQANSGGFGGCIQPTAVRIQGVA
ncbi:hypothetical protein [Pseudomonas syringae]|nr:hypothetical protein [Pseudomonas syringae]KZL42124.1 hypothetical protein VT47_00930 [Pseudomonas syringae pv. syringae]RMT37026.1 hypothetical protein ALP49_200115 [Pseudomonas syringae pv. solidagae]